MGGKMKISFCIIPLVFLICFTSACRDKAAMTELENFRTQALVDGQNADLVRGMFDELNNRNAGVYQEMFASGYGWHFPANNPQALTRDEEAEFVRRLWAAFPDMRWDIQEISACGGLVVARFTISGTHRGEYMGLPPTGNAFASGGIWLGRIKDKKLVAAREEADVLGMMQQLGMELKPNVTKK